MIIYIFEGKLINIELRINVQFGFYFLLLDPDYTCRWVSYNILILCF